MSEGDGKVVHKHVHTNPSQHQGLLPVETAAKCGRASKRPGGAVHVYSHWITGHFPSGAAQRAREERSCSPTGTPRVLVGGCVVSGLILLSLSWLNCFLGRKGMVEQARDMMCIFTSLKTAFVPQLSHQMHIHYSLFEGHAVMSLPVFSPAMGTVIPLCKHQKGFFHFSRQLRCKPNLWDNHWPCCAAPCCLVHSPPAPPRQTQQHLLLSLRSCPLQPSSTSH